MKRFYIASIAIVLFGIAANFAWSANEHGAAPHGQAQVEKSENKPHAMMQGKSCCQGDMHNLEHNSPKHGNQQQHQKP